MCENTNKDYKILLSDLVIESGLSGHAEVLKDAEISRFSPITLKENDRKVCVFLNSPEYINYLSDQISMIITTPEVAKEIDDTRFGICIAKEPRGVFFELLNTYEKRRYNSFSTVIGNNCLISHSATISETNVKIGNNVTIGENAIIEAGTTIEDDSVINGGCIIGAQNYLLYKFNGKNKQVVCRGNTVIGENTIIMHNSIIGRAAYDYDSTVIGKQCRIGQRVGIGHNSKLGDRVSVYSGCNIAGNVMIGNGADIYIGCTVINRISIGENSVINAGSVVLKDIPAGEKWMGNPARKIING